jgi:probable addiction module antidote protein
MPLETKLWDAADYLKSEAAVMAYIEAAMEDGDPAVITAALGDIARARGMSQIAQATGLSPDRHEGLGVFPEGSASPAKSTSRPS